MVVEIIVQHSIEFLSLVNNNEDEWNLVPKKRKIIVGIFSASCEVRTYTWRPPAIVAGLGVYLGLEAWPSGRYLRQWNDRQSKNIAVQAKSNDGCFRAKYNYFKQTYSCNIQIDTDIKSVDFFRIC